MVQGRLASIGYESSVTTREGDKGVRVMPREAGRLAHWLAENVGRIAAEHEVKPWLLGMGERERRLVLDGYVTGDGNYLNGSDSNLWQATSADRRLAISIKLLAQSLGQSVGLWHYDASSRKPSTIRGRTVRATGWYQLRGAAPGTTPLAPDSGHTYGCVREVRRTDIVRTLYDLTVECDESFVADGIVVHNSQDYPAPGWNEIQEALEHDHVDKDGNPDFNYEFYGVHSGARDTGFYSRATKGDFDMVHITALQRPDWGPQRKANAKAAYGGTSSPDYQRNILGRAGAAASPYFVLSRLLACVDQNRTSEYNEKEYVHQLLRAEDVDEVGLPIAEQLDLLGGKQVVYGGADIGLTISPTVISLFSLEMVKMDGERKARQRLKLFRRYTLERFRAKTIREVFYAIGFHHGNALQGFGIDATGLGRPIFQDMEDDEVAPQHLMDVARGYVFNVKVPVAVDKDHVSVDQGGRMRDQFGSQVKEEVDPLTGTTRLVTYMPMIEASTRYLADDIDSGLPLFPFDTEITADLQGETQQRVRVVGELKRKPNAMHILDSFRAMEMVYHSAQIEEQMAYEQAGPVLDRAI